MSKLRIMNQSGDTELKFDAKTSAGVQKAMERFSELLGKGHMAYARDAEGKDKLVKEFDPTAEEILMHPQLQGG